MVPLVQQNDRMVD